MSDKIKVVVVYDSNDCEAEPAVWGDPSKVDATLLNHGQEHGGRFPNTDPAEITLLEAGVHPAYPGFKQIY